MDFSLDFSGLAGTARDLETFSRVENNKILCDATRAGAEVMRDVVVECASERTGRLRKNVVVLTQCSKRRGEIVSGVHIRGRNLRTGNSDNSMRANGSRNAFYRCFVELGTINIPVHPFTRLTFDTTEELAAQVVVQRMNQAADGVLSKRGRLHCIPCCLSWPEGRSTLMWSR